MSSQRTDFCLAESHSDRLLQGIRRICSDLTRRRQAHDRAEDAGVLAAAGTGHDRRAQRVGGIASGPAAHRRRRRQPGAVHPGSAALRANFSSDAISYKVRHGYGGAVVDFRAFYLINN